ncbi:hypothetical protein [Paenibacillus azoreducens]|uniref:Lipoprotein n=1 Tax=Paenibacillus azoreducens TaxID=116718 RepID=A0A920CRB8_9BACL|nr:hypothetical protein [Paenibacillus azoreducens]GIO48100.1 hypothetical protein J34TS1_28650 [Paenibacillus azoreducens]
MLPKASFKIIGMMIAACFLLTSCLQHPESVKMNVAQKKAEWPNSEVTRESVQLALEDASGDGVIGIKRAKDIQLQGANNKTVTVDLKHESKDPDRLMKEASETLIHYSKILLKNKGIGTVEICMFGNPDPYGGKSVSKETVRIAINREDLQKGQDAWKSPVENYVTIFRHASWYKIHPRLYKHLLHKEQLKTRDYLK